MSKRTILLNLIATLAAAPAFAHVGEGPHLHPHLPAENPSLGGTALIVAAGAAGLYLLGSTLLRRIAARNRARRGR